MHHADAGGDRRRGIGDHHPLAVDPDLALIRLEEAEEDVHQRRLAGAILANDCVDAPPLDGEAHILIGDDRAETLGDRFQLNGDGHGADRSWTWADRSEARDDALVPAQAEAGTPRAPRDDQSLGPSGFRICASAIRSAGDGYFVVVATVILPDTTSAFSASSLDLTSAGILSATCGQSRSSTPPDFRS